MKQVAGLGQIIDDRTGYYLSQEIRDRIELTAKRLGLKKAILINAIFTALFSADPQFKVEEALAIRKLETPITGKSDKMYSMRFRTDGCKDWMKSAAHGLGLNVSQFVVLVLDLNLDKLPE